MTLSELQKMFNLTSMSGEYALDPFKYYWALNNFELIKDNTILESTTGWGYSIEAAKQHFANKISNQQARISIPVKSQNRWYVVVTINLPTIEV